MTQPLIVRLRNWVGDVVLSVPTLVRLQAAGHELHLIGKGWAADLLRGYGWPVHKLAGTTSERIAQLRTLRKAARERDPGFGRRLNAVSFPYSFGSALEMRLAGLRAIGYAHEGRGFLLKRSVQRPPRGEHELVVYWQLGSALLGRDAPPPDRIDLRLAPAHLEQAAELRARHTLGDGFIMICPFAGGTWDDKDKTWPGFADFTAGPLREFGRRIVVCPGPGGEEALARERFPGALLLPGVGLGAYAALMKSAALMISNDTGPGHMAAAVGAPLLSVLGPSEPAMWGAWGPSVHIVRGSSGDPPWPDAQQVGDAVARVLAGTR